MQLKLNAEFPDIVADCIREKLVSAAATETSVVAVFGVSALFGFVRFSQILGLVEGYIRGRFIVFFTRQYDRNNYRLLDVRDGWSYLAVPITSHGRGEFG